MGAALSRRWEIGKQLVEGAKAWDEQVAAAAADGHVSMLTWLLQRGQGLRVAPYAVERLEWLRGQGLSAGRLVDFNERSADAVRYGAADCGCVG